MTKPLALRERLRFAARLALRHLLVSALVAGLAALLVFELWYPFPTAEMLKVSRIYGILLLVDVVCGPLLTLVMANPRKSSRELRLDLALVGLIQLGALAYGLHSLEASRPVGMVFEADRLVVVGKNELYLGEDPSSAMQRPAFWSPIRWAMLKQPAAQDKLESLDLSLQGVSPARRPLQWVEWNWANPDFQSQLKPLSALGEPSKEKLRAARGAEYMQRTDRRFIPLVSAKDLDWIAVFDDAGQWVDSVPVDGF